MEILHLLRYNTLAEKPGRLITAGLSCALCRCFCKGPHKLHEIPVRLQSDATDIKY